ncbi:MAG: SpoIID/LytB domain-containing protein [Odoribacteraceae bacterium]|jgi:peptidoglycan hydrolase-like amidase|nr:SpoIID/LytB domain-containing protein [Odoribacteraceae bacterium]
MNNITVGILSAREIHFRLNGAFRREQASYSGEFSISMDNDALLLRQGETTERLPVGFTLEPATPRDTFDLAGVSIGIQFHWERTERQRFRGALSFIREEERLVAVNTLPLEEYLTSVISSEMNASAPPEYLKAHAVISRGWLLAQKEGKERDECRAIDNEGEYTRWFDRHQHALYDVCADDHCQRYQGVERENEAVARAVQSTRGEVLVYRGRVCDARFSKCCGGATERFDNTWEPRFHPYLVKVDDNATGIASPDLSVEENARAWILSSPPAECNVNGELLAGILNDYDRETRDFFRWTIAYPADELSALVESRLHAGLGNLLDLQPVERGVSGRLVRLGIVGERGRLVIGKELLIRRVLSPAHLYSSAFITTVERDNAGRPTRFILHGAGWGHGVGLCQIGAAMMSARGCAYREILARYFPGTRLETRY